MEFSDIAYAKFLSTAPELGNLILTFKDVSDELTNDSDIQVGIFILRAGDDLLFVPVVSKGDGVYPIDSIFINSKNKFFPLTKNTVQRVLNSQKPSMGSAKKIPDTVSTNPSVYHLVNPPRTGKFVYAASSRLTEFLTIIPNELKTHVLEKFSSDSGVYNTLNNLFDLRTIFSALKTSTLEKTDTPSDMSVGVKVRTDGLKLPTPAITSILTTGYFVDGENPLTRVAISTQNWEDGRFTSLSTLDNGDYDIVMKDGSCRKVYLPGSKTTSDNLRAAGTTGKSNEEVSFMLFENGDYAINNGAVTIGNKKDDKVVIPALFRNQPPILLKDLSGGETFAIFGPNMDLIGVYRASQVKITYTGCTVKAHDLQRYQPITIQGLRGYTNTPTDIGNEIFVPSTSLVVVLGNNINNELECTVMAAARRRQLLEWALLNTSLNLTYDNVEFSVNGKPIGMERQAMQLLVEDESIDPTVAESFIKKAKEQKKVVIYLSKKADFKPGEIPQFGNDPPKQINPMGTQQDRLPMQSLQTGVNTGDGQSIESVVISELLQSPDMGDYIDEYLPDIEEGIDRLGRILFLARIHINKLAGGNDTDEVFSFLSALKNVYKMLGDNYMKLEELAANASGKK